MDELIFNYFESPIGEIELAAKEGMLMSVLFSKTEKGDRPKQVVTESVLFDEAKNQFTNYFFKESTEFNLPLYLNGTVFQTNAWNALRTIPFGKTISYLDLAKKIGNVKAIRAAATTNGKNPFAIVIPCHRVIGSDASLTGYAGDLWRKKWLLNHEAKQVNQQLMMFGE